MSGDTMTVGQVMVIRNMSGHAVAVAEVAKVTKAQVKVCVMEKDVTTELRYRIAGWYGYTIIGDPLNRKFRNSELRWLPTGKTGDDIREEIRTQAILAAEKEKERQNTIEVKAAAQAAERHAQILKFWADEGRFIWQAHKTMEFVGREFIVLERPGRIATEDEYGRDSKCVFLRITDKASIWGNLRNEGGIVKHIERGGLDLRDSDGAEREYSSFWSGSSYDLVPDANWIQTLVYNEMR